MNGIKVLKVAMKNERINAETTLTTNFYSNAIEEAMNN